PEVSYRACQLLQAEAAVDGIMVGEGEETFAQVIEAYEHGMPLEGIPGTVVRAGDQIIEGGMRPVLSMDRIPFVYGDLSGYENRIIYYESSRGCPFSCSYCLSSIDKSVRFRSLDLVRRELDFFLEHQVPQVKFVDRTFNCKKNHSMAVWQHILEHDNGITNFHFEISADLLDEEELELLGKMRPGLVQLEIGVQSTNPKTVKEIRRVMDLEKLKQAVHRVNGYHNIHQHLDLIAGLPYEDYDSFGRSFDEVYAMEPEQLQLGFLKVLSGSYMASMAADYKVLYRGEPPYEVLSTSWLPFEDVVRLKSVEEMVEVYYNSGQYQNTLKALEREFPGPFSMFEALAEYYEQRDLFGISHNRLKKYEILYEFVAERFPQKIKGFTDLLIFDLYLRENVKSRPVFAPDSGQYKEEIKEFFIKEARDFQYLKGYEAYDSRQISKMAHVEVLSDGTFWLFDYRNRDPLNHNATVFRIR
ncbi:MAG: B12-binding domain-containing radical SAM protein, partial [Lachnospiraceae bacterium]